ncbi:MAG TPA: hypothetical protein VMH23_01050, partial [Bacteroidota bacterium]|nr:hypothetical protein [Bacteroidota bacterium]
LPLGEQLQPNSDEWRVRVDYSPVNRLSLSAEVQFQRTGENIVDPVTGRIVYNAGSDLLHGEDLLAHVNYFLQGNRVNRTFTTFMASWEPIRQYFVDLKVFTRSIRRPEQGTEQNLMNVWGTVRVDY